MTFSTNLKKKIKTQYVTDLAEEFYNPLLAEANLYQRVSGYFSSSGVDLYSDGLEELAKNGGEVQFIISKQISKKDFEKIQAGYNLKEELKSLRISERNDKLTTEAQQQLGNLAFMIANGRARVKVALTQQGIFHDKFGIISSDGDRVFFSGSANETRNGIRENYESISVDVSWDDSVNVQNRIEESVNRFVRLWNDREPGIKVIEASELTYEEISPYQEMATITEIPERYDFDGEVIKEETIAFRFFGDRIVRIDNTSDSFTNRDRKLRLGGDLTTFFEDDNSTVKNGVSYKDLQRIIAETERRAKRKNILVSVSDAVKEYIIRNKYSIEHYKILGEVYKGEPCYFPMEKRKYFEEFSQIVQNEVARPLREAHLRAAYFQYEMMRAANFSVPGAGKTAMLLGVFAYLNREDCNPNEKLDRILVISPLNAFESWKKEFKTVFGEKKELRVIDAQNKRFKQQIKLQWSVSNLILVNYESLSSNLAMLKKVIDSKTLLVFDEVHRIKNPDGQRAQCALEIAKLPRYRYVLTGTPIPNKYTDIYNFLHILYGNEYNSFFGWDIGDLKNPKVREIKKINEKLYPFFWRTNKKDLKVPDADEDIVKSTKPSVEQIKLAEAIYANEKSSLAILIRLIQASTNPELLNYSIDYDELMSFDDDESISDRISGISKKEFYDLLGEEEKFKSHDYYDELDVTSMGSPKFEKGIELVKKLTSEGKKVLVWGIFVNTITKIQKSLQEEGIRVNLVYGGTPKEERACLIDEFRDGDVQVLVSNPQTLGESISLHQTVHDAVYFEYDFNLTHMLQSRDRIHRLGLEPNQYTRYYYLQTESEDFMSLRAGYIDEKIYRRIKEKERIMYEAIDNRLLSIEYSEDEILEAISIIDEERRRINKNESQEH